MSTNHTTHTRFGSAPSRKQQIVELSADLLREKGFSGFSYQDLAKALGINKASIHHHFPQKVDLGLALCDWTQSWLQQGFEHFDANDQSPLEKLNHYLATAARHTFNEQKLCPVSALNSELVKLPEAMQQRLAELATFELKWIEQIISDAQQAAELQPIASPQQMAQLFIHSCKGALYYGRLKHTQSEAATGKHYFQHSMELLINQWRSAPLSNM